MITEIDRLKMVRELEGLEHKATKIKELVSRGFISERFGEYISQLTIIDFLGKESEMFARLGDLDRTGHSLAEAKITVDSIASLYLQPLLEKDPVAFFENRLEEHYKELINLAKVRYEQSLNECEQILEAAA